MVKVVTLQVFYLLEADLGQIMQLLHFSLLKVHVKLIVLDAFKQSF